jgi:hypothetical protein
MDAQMMFNIVNFCLLAFLGGWLTRRISAPKNQWGWVFWLVMLVIAPYIGVSAKLVALSGYVLYFNIALQGLVFGLLEGWLTQTRQGNKQVQKTG